jgi:hypothetical protein
MLAWRRFLTVTVLALTIVGVLGHVCVLPLHAHASTASEVEADHRHDDSGPAHQHHDDGAVHAASCDVVAAPSSSLLAQPVSATPQALAVVSGWDCGGAFASAPPSPSASPPLYLTQRALRI